VIAENAGIFAFNAAFQSINYSWFRRLPATGVVFSNPPGEGTTWTNPN
jgi:hypothetical protein